MKKILFLALLLFLAACGSTEESEPKEDTTPPAGEETAEEKDNITWEEKVGVVAASEGTETEKYDDIVKYAKVYQPTEDEITQFEDYIIKEYQDGNYIMDISNHEYMLENIFKSAVVEQYYDEGAPMKDFAFDFYQNSKYNYRGVDNMMSPSTLSNEEQMNKALEEMNR